MNPYVTLIHAYLSDDLNVCYRLIGQFFGIFFACVYCSYFRPPDDVLNAILSDSGRLPLGEPVVPTTLQGV